METVVSSLVVAALSGLAFIAYKHPAAFIKIGAPLGIISLTASLLISAWSLGVSFTFKALKPFIHPDNLEKARAVISDLNIPDWVPIANSAFAFYLAFLFFLPRLLGEHYKAGQKHD